MEATLLCERQNATLVEIHNQDKMDFVRAGIMYMGERRDFSNFVQCSSSSVRFVPSRT